MKKRHKLIDGITLRRSRSIGDSRSLEDDHVPSKFLQNNDSPLVRTKLDDTNSHQANGLKRSDIDESLEKFNQQDGKKKRRRRPSKKTIKRIVISFVVLLILLVGYIGIKALIASSNIFGGNLFDLLSQEQPLKMDANGRSNIVIFGTSEDDRFEHGGASLTDSIMIMSLDQNKKVAAITSVPRDLWVRYDTSCEFGNEGKVNVVYVCGAGQTDVKEHSNKGAKTLTKKIGEVYGLEMQYYVHVNYSALKQAVDAVGGVDVVIDASDPRGILDRNFDWECNYQCYYVKYPNGKAHLDGKRALFLARARNDSGGYGLAGGNFDREKNQQKILLALRKKALSAGTLANPVAATSLIDSIGDNVKTNFVAGEIKTLIKLSQTIKDDKIDRIDLSSEKNPLLTTGPYNGQSIVRPVAGIYDYSQLQLFLRQRLSSSALVKESASLVVLNGSGKDGAGANMKKALEDQGFLVVGASNAVESDSYGRVSIYKLSAGKQPETVKKLEKVLKTKVKKGPLPFNMSSTADFVVIVGK